MEWMKKPEANWLCKKSFGAAPVEEMRKDTMDLACPMALTLILNSCKFYLALIS
jgi:hypothetical protein